jgi:hypothetical protein
MTRAKCRATYKLRVGDPQIAGRRANYIRREAYRWLHQGATFALCLGLFTCQMPLRNAAASGTFFKCSNNEIIHRDWNSLTRAGKDSYSHYSPAKRDYDRAIPTRAIRDTGDFLYYRGKKCRVMSNEEIQALRWNDD